MAAGRGGARRAAASRFQCRPVARLSFSMLAPSNYCFCFFFKSTIPVASASPRRTKNFPLPM